MFKIKWIIGSIFTLSLILCILITSFEIAVYSDRSFFEKEYTKYDVVGDLYMEMGDLVEMDDLMDVTDAMMKYLKGQREELQVKTNINGIQTDFFNESEIAHMEDVRGLFLGGIWLRRICMALMLISVLILLLLKERWILVLSRSLKWGIIVLAVISSALAAFMALNFTKAFTAFHKIFFNNDLWILDPERDRLINILPEGFFLDTALRIGIIFGILILLSLLVAIILEHAIIKKRNYLESK